MILRIIAIEGSDQERCQNLIDEYHEAGLIENCLTVDVSDPQDWKACFPNEEYSDLVSCLNRGLWDRIVLVSLRRELEDGMPSPSRVAAESLLRDFLASRYSSSVGLVSFTLSQVGTSIHDSMFPENFQANYLHQREIDVDPRLPRVNVSGDNIDQVLVFTALTISGAGKWVTEPIWHSVDDFSIGTERLVRFVRVQTRIGLCGPLVANLVKAAVRPGGGSIPAGLPVGSFTALNEEANEMRKLSESFIEKYQFRAMPRPRTADDSGVIIDYPWWKAMLLFFTGFGKYLRSAVISEWHERVESITRPLLSKLQDITFGDDSTIIIKGVKHDISSEALARFAEELKSRLEGLDGVTAPKQTPDVWTGLLRTSFALLDGSDYPAVTAESLVPLHVPMSSGKRIIFMQPSVVGPDLTDDQFVLSPADCRTLELDPSRARSVGMFESYEVDRLREEVGEAVSRMKFRADLDAIARHREETKEAEGESPKSRLRGTLSRPERLAAEKAESSKAGSDAASVRGASDIGTALDTWLKKRESLSKDSLVAHLFESLDKSIEHEVSALRWDDLVSEIEELVKPLEAPKMRFRRILKIFGLILIPLVVAAVLLSSVIGAITAVLGIPILVFVLIVWGTSFAFALVVAVFKRALALRSLDFKKKTQASDIEKKYRELVHSINEFRRLQLLKVQFSDWQRLAREIAHHPYGRIDDSTEVVEVIDEEAIPPQLVVARLEPDAAQATMLRNFARDQLRVSGYLDGVLVELQSDWKEDYESIQELARMQPVPELDVSPAGLDPNVEHAGRRYFFARRDFVESSINGDLRATLLDKKVRSLSENIFARPLVDVFSTVASGLNRAFATDSPFTFLAGLSSQSRRAFSAEYFAPEKRDKDGAQELDERFSYLTPENSEVKPFLVSGDDQHILLSSTRVDVSHAFSPDRLEMYSSRKTVGPVVGRSSIDEPPV